MSRSNGHSDREAQRVYLGEAAHAASRCLHHLTYADNRVSPLYRSPEREKAEALKQDVERRYAELANELAIGHAKRRAS